MLHNEKNVDSSDSSQDGDQDRLRVCIHGVHCRDVSDREKESSNCSCDTQHEMEVTNDEVRIVIRQINRLVGKKQTSEASEHETDDEASGNHVLEVAQTKL